MKKVLFATTALLLTAGYAAADVKISGYGRTGVIYYEDGVLTGGGNDTQIYSRLRMNLDASTSTDQGVDFGARFRMQWDQNSDNGGTVNAGKLWVTSSGLTVEIGNVDTAFDSADLLYGSELGAFDRSFGNPRGDFWAYHSDPYGDDDVNYTGVHVIYEVGDLILRGSYVDPDQTGWDEGDDRKEEIGISVDYKWNDRLELSAAAVQDGAGIADNDQWYVGGRYGVRDNAHLGLNYIDNGNDDFGNTITLYGDFTLADGNTNLEAYIANNNGDLNDTDNAFGIGVNYDLGGARLGASLQRDYYERVTADMGVRFEF